MEVPHFEGVVFGRRDQDGLNGVEGQPPDGVEVAAQGELRVPGLPQRVLVVADLRRQVQNRVFRVGVCVCACFCGTLRSLASALPNFRQ